MSYNGPNPLTVASWAERLARQNGQMSLAFTVITAVSLGIVVMNAWQDLSKRQESNRRER